MRTKIRMVGEKTVLRNLAKITKKLESTAKQTVGQWTNYGQWFARSLAPRDTGTLVSSITGKTFNTNKKGRMGLIYVTDMTRGGLTQNELVQGMHNPAFKIRWGKHNGRDRYFMNTTYKDLVKKVPADIKEKIINL